VQSCGGLDEQDESLTTRVTGACGPDKAKPFQSVATPRQRRLWVDSSDQAAMLTDPPASFPDYTAVERIYIGSRSTVYRARRAADDRPVMLKVANAGHATLGESLARLRHELGLLQAIRSDRVIRGLDVATSGHDAMLVVEDFGGESLDRYLARARFSLADALGLAIGVVAGLRDVHAAGIIHKDITPNNIVFNAATGETRLIDFDVATAWRTDHHGFVSPTTLEGTLLYMAPEQTGRMNRAIDSRADLYAFGVTLFELVTGRLPFVDTDILSIVHAHLAVRPPAPDTIDATIPRPVSAIVMRLLAKAPEDRYQTAEGLLADLETCVTRLARTGTVDDFALGSDDVTKDFELPTKLYGRSAELGVLASAFERIAAGAVETVLVSGHSGVGKTSVVRELFPQITRQRGYFLSGKFDQLRGDAPYPALVAAFDELTHHLLTQTEDELTRWREQIAAAIAPNGRIVIDAIPALERIIGAQPAVVALDAAATQGRFNLTLQKFIQVFTRRAHPLVLFLDDMQWADPESIQLLKLVALSESTECFLLIMAFRDNEISDGHPLMAAVRDLRKHRRVTRLDLAPLPAAEIAALVADTLHSDTASIAPLARLVCRKTDGNPFFVRQLLLALHVAGHIRFDPDLRRFTFDAASIEDAPISENVADLLADSLRKLPLSTQHVLALAAAIGNRFELELLAFVAGASQAAVHAELAAALEHELVVPLSELEYVAAPDGSGLVFRRLRFQHDRIQHAAYALMSADDQRRMHQRIGELLLATASPAELADRIFEVVSHLNRAIVLLEPAQLTRLARLDLMAARKARGSAAYGVAIDCLRVTVEQLDWRADYRDQLEAHLMLAECIYHAGDIKCALGVLDAAAAHAEHNHDRGEIEALRATFYIHANDMKTAIRSTRRAAALLGRVLPADPAELGRAIGATIGAILQRIGDREIEQLIDLPVMTELDPLALMTLFRDGMPAAFQLEPPLGAFITAQMVLLSLEHGNCTASARGYGAFAGVLHGTELHHLAYRFGKLGVELNLRLDDRASRPSVEFVFALFSLPWVRPITEAIGYLRDAARCGREVGDHIHAGSSAAFEIAYRVFHGSEPMAEICRDAKAYRQQAREVGEVASARLITYEIDRLRVLMGELASLSAEDPDSQITLMATREEANTAHQFSLLNALVDVTYSTGDEATALDLATATRLLEGNVVRMLVVVEHQFFHCLAAVAVCRRSPGRRSELEPVIDANQRALERWAVACPANFEAMYLLVEAERAALTTDLEATLALYDRATASAASHGRRRLEALAGELHGRFWSDNNKPEIAQIYIARARNLYATLGAQRNIRTLERKHPAIVRAIVPIRLSTTVTTSTASEVLDVTAIAKATRAISGELELDKLLERMLEIIFENAGADGGALVLETARGLTVAASRTAGALRISTTGVPLSGAVLPRSLVHYVQRTGTTVVLDDAMADLRFADDDYIRARALKSVLCMPVKHKDRLIGVLYLENTLVSGAFTPSRLDALTILASQIAVSLENAALFAAQRVQAEAISRANGELRSEITVREQAERELAHYRTQLEDVIAERTQELTLANQKLRDAAAERERIEAELRLAQKLESVGRLAAGIAHEINTPVQYVSDSLTFMRDALPSLLDTIGRYRELAATIEGHGDVAAAAAGARAADAEADVDYAVTHAPAALAAALDGLGRVAAIVRSMKDFAHPDRDEKTLVDLNRAIESTLMIAANECKYVAVVHTELAALPLVRCNGGEINQAVLNLVINAAHAIRDVVGQTGAKGKIVVRTRRDGGEVEIAISDTGTGIPDAIRDKIYDPFFTTKEVGRGTGQGLAIVRGVVVDRHAGSLRFDTVAGVGTTFFLRLPIDDALESAA
jgi:predicted ATPase/signal transduction histidine kinase/tRNA A-37 threonylcarbamoyl transferase component Bud32